MSNEELVERIIECVGGRENIIAVQNCMTRLRFQLKNETSLLEQDLKNLDGVLGLVHSRRNYLEVVVGPGKCRKCADICYQLGLAAAQATGTAQETDSEWQANKAEIKAQQKSNAFLGMLKTFGEIFVPLIPGVILAGLCSGMATLLVQSMPESVKHPFWGIVYHLLQLISTSFMAYISAWAGYKAAERFGATPILGGMLGMVTSLGGINEIAGLAGLFDAANPLNSVLRSGRGGVLAAVLGVWLLAKVEKEIRKRIPESMDVVFTPMLSMFICVVPYVLIVMPLTGMLSTGLCKLVEAVCMSPYLWVRLLAGYVAAVVFLPMVAMGMHHGLVALYTVQLASLGYVTLYPALAMAGAGQVGTALAIYYKCKNKSHERLKRIIKGALPAGVLGVGEPLIYGVTLPLGRPFLLAGLGAGFGGAFVMAMQVASTTWGPSGVLAFFVMTAGPNPASLSLLYYGIGLAISYIMGFVLTYYFYDEASLSEKPLDNADKASGEESRVKHGDTVMVLHRKAELVHIVKDPLGIHARPAGEIVNLLKTRDCNVTIRCGAKAASGNSVIELLKLGAVQGAELKIAAEGPEAEKALLELKRYLERKL